MRSETAKRIIAEMPDSIKQISKDYADSIVEKTTETDMQRMYDYMDKLGVNYTVDNNPTPEKIEQIKASIARQENLANFVRSITKI